MEPQESADPPPGGTPTTGLLERDDQVERVAALLRRSAAGHGALVIVDGPPGIGKSALLDEVARRAASVADVLGARCSEAERDFAFGGARQLFERRLASAAPAARRRLLAGAAGLAAPLFAVARGRPGTAPAHDPHASLRGLYWLTANLTSAAPLVLTIDDAQWLDPPSLRFCEYLASRLDELPVVLVLAVRSALADAGLADAGLADLRSRPRTTVLTLPALSERAVATLVHAQLGEADAALAAACSRVTGGNPFLVRELLRSMAAGTPRPAGLAPAVPSAVQAWIAARLARCGPDAQLVARAAAVLEPRADLDRVAALAGLPLARAAAAADEMTAAAILSGARPCTFVHPLVLSAVAGAIPSGERSTLHGRAAALLASRHVEAAEVARHLAETEPAGEPWAVDALVAAAGEALGHGAPEVAARWLRRALAEPMSPGRRGALLHRLALAEQRLGEAGATAHLREAFALTEDVAARADVLRALLLRLLSDGREQEVRGMLEATLPALVAGDPELATRLEAEVVSAARHTLTASLWVAGRLRGWRHRARPDSAGGRLLLANLATQCALDGGPAEEAAALALAALAGGRLLHEQTADAMPVYQAAWQLTAAERLDAAEESLNAALADARHRGSLVGFASASLFLSYVELARGRVPPAETHAVAALDAARQARLEWFARPAVVAGLVDVYVEQDRHADAERLLADEALAGMVGDTVPLRLLLCSRGALRLAAGRPAEAAADLLELAGRELRLQALSTHLAPYHGLASLALQASGRMEEAARFAATCGRDALAWGTPRVAGRALRVRARLEPTGEAGRTLTEAVGRLEGSAARLDLAWARLERGALLLRAGRRADAVQDLRAALDLGHACGGRAVERVARDHLVACGYRPRRAASTGIDALTASERGVAAMAARGMRNRAIAQALFVTERTVELHLTNAYRKLGIGSRQHLGEVLAGTGLGALPPEREGEGGR